MNSKIKKKVDDILYRSHLIITNSSGLDISKTKREEARRESRKVLKELKDIEPRIFNIIKNEFNG